MNLASLVSDQSRAVVVLVLLLCVAGLYAAYNLPTAIFPQTDFPRVVVIVDNGVVPADQMLVSVTRPIEEAMNGIPGILRIASKTARGSCEINLYFDWHTDAKQSLQLVQARLAQLALPPTATISNVARLTFAVFPVISYSLTSDTRDPSALRDLAAYTIKPRLARLSGVADVAVAGGQVREFHITLDPEKLAARGGTQRDCRNHCADNRLDYYARRGFSPTHFADRRDRRVFSFAGLDDGGGVVDFAGFSVDVYADSGRKIRARKARRA